MHNIKEKRFPQQANRQVTSVTCLHTMPHTKSYSTLIFIEKPDYRGIEEEISQITNYSPFL